MSPIKNGTGSLSWFAIVVATMALCFAAGCSSDSGHGVAPEATGTPPLSELSTEAQDSPVWARDLRENDSSSGLIRLLPLLPRVVTELALILPGSGGKLASDRYALEVPPNALDFLALYKLEHGVTGLVEVNLYPHGATFDTPVSLEIDLSWTTLAGYDDVTLYWWDEDAREWVDVGGTWDSESKTLTTELDHFSRYRPGRAGW